MEEELKDKPNLGYTSLLVQFLYGYLDTTVFMAQPQGFVDTACPTHIWADASLFIFRQSSDIMILLLYVDDIVLTGNQTSLLSSFVATLGKEFELNDLGPLSYFLGLEANSTSFGLHILQTKYIVDLLKRHSMIDCKPCTTPYLTFTRPDISFVVNHVTQFMSTPRSPHLVVAKRILRYLKGSLGFELSFGRSHGPLTLRGFNTRPHTLHGSLMLIGLVALILVA
ncbi:unnamed protein product [Prunus armeniaca]